jgi:excisionase family DNA binding protein
MSDFEHISEVLERIFQKLEVINSNTLKREKPFLDISEASEYLNLSKNTLYFYCSKNRIPSFKVGKKIFFNREELNNWIFNKKNKRMSTDEIEQEVADQIISEKSEEKKNFW